jgi:Transglycosylase SLT domain
MDNGNANYSGTSNPGPLEGTLDGSVTIANPESSSGSTPSLTAPAPQAPPQAQQGPPPPQPQPNQNYAQASQQQGPQQSGKPADLSKAPAAGQANGAPAQAPVPQHIQQASKIFDIAQTLAGGPTYNYQVSADGTMQKTQVPVSNSKIGLAIAMNALSGAFTGMSAGGPQGKGVIQNPGRAGAAAFDQAAQRNQQADLLKRQQAQQQFNTQAVTTENNMRLYANARQVGRLDQEANDKYVSQFQPLVDKLQTEYPQYIRGVAHSYADLANYHVTADQAIPYRVNPRLDASGNPVLDANGVPQSDLSYLIIDPSLKTSGLLSQDDLKTATKWGMTGMNNPNIADAPLSMTLAMGKKSQIAGLNLAENEYNTFFDDVNKASGPGQTTTGPIDPKTGVLTAPKINDPIVATLTDKATDNIYASSGISNLISAGNFKALAAAVTNQESGGNSKTPPSSTGAVGPFQLTQKTAQSLGVKDRNDTTQNINGGVAYLAQLLKANNGDINKTLASYYSGSGSINPKTGQIQDNTDPNSPNFHSAQDTQKYIDQTTARLGLNQTQQTGPAQQSAPDPAAYAASHPGFMNSTEKFMSALTSLPQNRAGMWQDAISHLASTGNQDAANQITGFLTQGNPKAIQIHDNQVTTDAEIRKAQVTTDAQEDRLANKNQIDADQQAQKAALIGSLESAIIPDNAQYMDPKALVANLQAQGVKLTPEDIRNMQSVANYSSPLSVVSNNPRYKTPGALNQSDLEYGAKIINPNFKAGNFKNLNDYNNPSGKAFQSIQAASAAAQHLQLLQQASSALAAGDQKTALPILNKLANDVGYHAGGTAYVQMASIINALTPEMGKALSSGFAPNADELKSISSSLNPAMSDKQVQAVTKRYMELLSGKMTPLAESYSQLSGGDRLNVPQSLTNAFQTQGLDTPWAIAQAKQPNANQNQPKTNNVAPKGTYPIFNKQGQIAGYMGHDGKPVIW